MRGSLSLAEIEGRVQQASVPNGHTDNHEESSDNSAFNSLLMSMKNAGQLPEKPSPIVSLKSKLFKMQICKYIYI